MRHALSLLLLLTLAGSLAAQTTYPGHVISEQLYASGPYRGQGCIQSRIGTTGLSYGLGMPVTGTVGMWDLGRQDSLIKGGYDLVPASDH